MAELQLVKNGLASQERKTQILENELTTMKEKLAKQGEIIIQQQKFLEIMDCRERETNIIISGLNENNNLDGATDDSQKCKKIMQVIQTDCHTIDFR